MKHLDFVLLLVRDQGVNLQYLHEEGVSVNTIRIRLGHESLDVTLAYLKGKDAESEEAQEHANSSSLALYA
jgi:hypothetical protein